MKKALSWALCAAMIVPAIVAAGCDQGTTSTPAQVQSHMAKKESKEKSTFKAP